MFSNEKNGYTKSEVDAYIENLKKDYESKLNEQAKKINSLGFALDQLKIKKETISTTLMTAVEKAKQIEDSSKTVYRNKIQQMKLLYDKWDKLLDEMLEKYPNLTETQNIKNMVASFQEKVKLALQDDGIGEDVSSIGTSNDPIRALLGRMNSYQRDALITAQKPVEAVEKPKEQSRQADKKRASEQKPKKIVIKRIKEDIEVVKPDERPINLKPIADVKIDKDEDFETLADKFLSESNDDDSSAFAKAFSKQKKTKDEIDPFAIPQPNESGFNLEEAINPTEELEEIMSAFDFFDKNKK